MSRYRFATSALIAALGLVTAAPLLTARAADSVDGCADPVAPDCGDVLCGDSCGADAGWTNLTGDWLGLRSHLQESGVTFAGRSTHFGFGVDGGINPLAPTPPALGPGNVFLYTGRGEYDLNFDLEKFGGLPFGKLLVRAEHWYGEYGNVSLRTGAFPPAVFPAAIPPAPNSPGELYMTNFVVTQPLSENFVLFAGKKDVLGAADQDVFAGGDGTDQFMNQALIANPAFLLGLPYTSFTTGVAMPQDWGMISAFVYDPKDRTRDFFDIDDLFAQGVILGGEVKVDSALFGMPGEHHLGGMWKHVDLTDLRFNEPPPGVYPEPVVPGFPTIADSWTIYYGADQFLALYANEPRKGWGLFGRASLSDGNPTPVRYFLSGGLGGDSILRGGQGDRWGIGYYYLGASDEFGPIPQFVFGPRDGQGLEMFYNFQVNPWLNVTPDVQLIRPEAGAIADDAFVYGLRVNLTL
jgi:porin